MVFKYLVVLVLLFDVMHLIKIGPFEVTNVMVDDNGKLKHTDSLDNFHNVLSEVTQQRKKRSNENILKRKRRGVLEVLESKIGIGSNYTVYGPRCIPLQSQNIEANPYHPSLLSSPAANVRRGLGLPTLLALNPISCPAESIDSCTLVISKSISVSVTDSYSISFGGSQTYSKAIGKTATKGSSNSYTNSIGKTIERSFAHTDTQTNEESLADTVSEAIQKTHETSSGISITRGYETSETNTFSQDITKSNTVTNEISLSNTLSKDVTNSASFGGSSSNTVGGSSETSNSNTDTLTGEVSAKFLGMGASVSASNSQTQSQSQSSNWANSQESNWNNGYSNTVGKSRTASLSLSNANTFSASLGRSNAQTQSFSGSATKDNRVSDSISVTREAARTKTRTQSNSQSNTQTDSNSYRIDDSYTSTDETSIAKAINDENSTSTNFGNETSHSETITTTLGQDITYPVAPGTCKIPVCFPFVKAVAIPFECLDLNGASNIVNVDYMIPDAIDDQVPCTFGLIDCEDRDKAGIFLVDSVEFKTSTLYNSIEYGSVISGQNLLLLSQNERYSLFFDIKGNLVLKLLDTIVWENSMGFFDNITQLRLRINEKGHLVQEVKGLFSNATPSYRSDDWIIVWSSMPKNFNVTVGVPINPGVYGGYKLIAENNGDLNLYDAVGTVIWSATKQNAKHRYGYKFPENYLVPTNFIAPIDVDAHNSIHPSIIYRRDYNSTIKSLDINCNFTLNSNEALKSNNGRFKLILENTGNLIIKDGYRTMWESSSANLPYATGPYQLIISPTGDLIIIDAYLHMIWKSVSYVANTTRPYRVQVLDEGRVVVRDNKGIDVWESWPVRNMSFSLVFFTQFEYRFMPCHGLAPANKSLLVSNTDNVLENNQLLVSKDGNWDFYLWNSSYVAIRYQKAINISLYNNKSSQFQILVFYPDSTLRLIDTNNNTLLQLGYAVNANFGPYYLIIDNNGVLNAVDRIGNNIWSYPYSAALKFRDQFTTATLDPFKWNVVTNRATSRGRLQTYFANETYQSNRSLVIRCERFTNGATVTYGSGRINSSNKFDFLYGEIEWRAKMPVGRGIWSSLGLSEYPNTTNASEIVMQVKGDQTNQLTATVYLFTNGTSQTLNSRPYVLPSPQLFTTDMHLFRIIWEPSYLAFFVDNNLIMSICDTNKIPKRKMFITIDASVGGDFSGSPDTTTVFPSYFYVDYVNVTRLVGSSTRIVKSFDDINYNMRLSNDMGYFNTTVAENCHLKCRSTANCVASSFISPFWCFLFDNNYISNYDAGWRTTFSRCQEITQVFTHNDVQLLSEFLKQGLNSSTDCWNLCKSHINCISSSFKDNICYLFNSSFQYQKNRGWVSHVYKNLILTNGIYQTGLRLFDPWTQMSSIKTIDDCWKICITYPNCTAVSFNPSDSANCFLFSAKYRVTYDSDFNSIATNFINQFDFYINKNFQLTNYYKTMQTQSPESCFGNCNIENYLGCVASSFSYPNCYLFKSGYGVQKNQNNWISYTYAKIL